MSQKLEIFISTYKNFECCPKSDCYTIVHGNEEPITHPLKQIIEVPGEYSVIEKQKLWNEGSRLYYIYHNYDWQKNDYIGLNHYRRYFNFFDTVPNMDDIFSTYDVILPPRLGLGTTLEQQYINCHNFLDFIQIKDIIKDLFPDYIEAMNKTLKQTHFYACSMFIMKKEYFQKYCEFVFPVLLEFDKIRGFNTDEDVEKHVTQYKHLYIKQIKPMDTIGYQSRINGFLLERLTNIFVNKHFNNILEIPVIETEKKYGMNLFPYIQIK